MPSVIFTDAQVLITTSTVGMSTGTGTIDISDFVTAVRLNYTADEHDDTVMGLTAHSRVQGLFTWDAELEMLQDFLSSGLSASYGVDKLLFDLINNKVKVNVFIRPVAAARSSDNPEYYGSVRLRSHQPMTGAVGDLLKTTVPLMSAGNLFRGTSAT